MTTSAASGVSAVPELPSWLTAQHHSLLRQRGHAWLLQGPAGMGQFELAVALACAWLCEQPGPEGAACGQCASCHAVAVHAHADLCVLMPEVQLLQQGWPLGEKAQAEIDEKKRKPSKDIRVDAMREAVEFCQRTSARGRGKAVLIYPAEQMNAIAANALLKTLEEPVGHVRFVLATEAAHALLPTIRSRCLAHNMGWPPKDAALAWLHSQGLDARSSALALRAAGGSPAQALHIARSHYGLLCCEKLPQLLRAGDSSALADVPAPELLTWLHKLCHDLMRVTQGAAPWYFAQEHLPPPVGLSVLQRWAKALAQATRVAEHPFNPGLMTQALVVQAQRVLHSRA